MGNNPHKKYNGIEDNCDSSDKEKEKTNDNLVKDTNVGKGFVRPINTPSTTSQTRLFKAPEPLSEISIQSPGVIPIRVIVPTKEITPSIIKEIEAQTKDFPRLEISKGNGAVDIRLETQDGTHIKDGFVVLENAAGKIGINIDPRTRRFRKGNLLTGEYFVKGYSIDSGNGSMKLTIREGDVTRGALKLDSTITQGTGSLRIKLKGSNSSSIKVHATDKLTGKVVFDRDVKVNSGIIDIENIPVGRIHLDIDDGTAKSCYDSDVFLIDIKDFMATPIIEFNPIPDPDPDPRFIGLAKEYASLINILPDLGVNSLVELALAEPEGLMHKARKITAAHELSQTPISPSFFANAVEEARKTIGIELVTGENTAIVDLQDGKSLSRAFLSSSPGEAEFKINLGPDKKGELIIETSKVKEKRTMTGSDYVKVDVTSEDIASRNPIRLQLTNLSEGTVSAVIQTKISPDAALGMPPTKSIKERIENIYKKLSVNNPGINTTVSEFALAPENIQAMLQRARAFLNIAGACSIDYLGTFDLNPCPILQAGIYIAPVVQPVDSSHVQTIDNYSFAEVFGNNVIHYEPNEILHETAIVAASEWDISGRTMVIGNGVRELVVIAKSIRYNAESQITWETPILPDPESFAGPASDGQKGSDYGANGKDGQDGEQNPVINRGADAILSAPTVSLYVLNATKNLPLINLKGQDGRGGGVGQDGGRGGDGKCGIHAVGWAFCGCEISAGGGGNGGNGGKPGRGGTGGNGGSGGKIRLFTSPASIKALESSPPVIDITGGRGGHGGLPGGPGPGGIGGSPGSAECEPWCEENPEGRGSDGSRGATDVLIVAEEGKPGPMPTEDAIQIFPITEELWKQQLNNPHILKLDVYEAEPGELVTITGEHFDPSADKIFFDGLYVGGSIKSTASASFTIPLDSNGGYHPVLIRNSDNSRRSNRTMLKVIPKLDEIPAGTRWVENQSVNLTGLAFSPGLQVIAEDWSPIAVAKSIAIAVVDSTRTSINIQIPGAPLANLRGVRRIRIRNPDAGISRGEHVVRISDTIVVRCAAFKVTGTSPGTGSVRADAEITNLFTEGSPISISTPWGKARISFRLVQPVGKIIMSDHEASMWPGMINAAGYLDWNTPRDKELFNAGHIDGALNFYFFRDLEFNTGYSYFGGGPVLIGDEASKILEPIEFQHLVAHETGHSLCLRHVCTLGVEPKTGTLFNRLCNEDLGDATFLMYPYYDVSHKMDIPSAEIDTARRSATHFEDGKTSSLRISDIFSGTATNPQCTFGDTTT